MTNFRLTLMMLQTLTLFACAENVSVTNAGDSNSNSSGPTPVAESSRKIPNFSIEKLESAIDETVTISMQEEHLPGVAVVVVKDGRTVFKRGYGTANFDTDQAVDPDKTIFRIGSISKVLTALAVTHLADQGRISLEDNVSMYFDGFEAITNAGGGVDPVRVKHLITHTGGLDQIGLDRHIWNTEKTLSQRKALRPDLVSYLSSNNLRRTSSPGVHYRYDTYGITLAGAILSNVTGKSYDDAMRAELFDPLGMTRTSVEVAPLFMNDLAAGYGYNEGKFEPAPYEIYVTTPASSIDATPADMGLLLEALTSDGTSSRGKLFSAEINALVTSPQFRPHPDFPGVTHGLLEHPKATGAGKHHIRTLAHGGTMLGYTASLSILPDINTGIFIVTNRDSEAGGGPVSFQWKTIEAILDVIHTVERPSAFSVPQIDAKLDLAEYAGEYYFGVFCRTCTQDEFNRGAWQKGAPIKVRVGDGGLSIEDRIYRPIGHHGVFVSVDGLSKVFFGRDKAEIVSFFSFHSSPDTFEKIHEATPNEDIR